MKIMSNQSPKNPRKLIKRGVGRGLFFSRIFSNSLPPVCIMIIIQRDRFTSQSSKTNGHQRPQAQASACPPSSTHYPPPRARAPHPRAIQPPLAGHRVRRLARSGRGCAGRPIRGGFGLLRRKYHRLLGRRWSLLAFSNFPKIDMHKWINESCAFIVGPVTCVVVVGREGRGGGFS